LKPDVLVKQVHLELFAVFQLLKRSAVVVVQLGTGITQLEAPSTTGAAVVNLERYYNWNR